MKSLYTASIVTAVILQAPYALPLHAGAGDDDLTPQEFFCRTVNEDWLEPASAAILAVKMSGDTVACSGSRKMLLPASTMKALTTGLALHSLGPDYRFETRLGYSGEIDRGVLHGDLYIIGGADPTLGSRNPVAEPVETVFRKWKSFLDEAGIRSIDGHIVGDSRFFDSTAEIDSWQWNDIGTYYGTGTSGLSFNENMQNINVTPGSAPGKPLKISIGYPDLPWMRYTFSCTTGEAGTGNTLYLFTSPFSTEGEMRGSFAIDRKTKTEQVSNKFPAYTCAWHFSRYLSGCGISCSGGAADLGRVFGLAPGRAVVQDSLTIIGTTYSPELSSIASETNHESNNMFAETLFKTIGREYCGEGTYDAALKASEGLLKELGAGTEGLHQADGSGLSRQDSFSPEFMCGFLAAMMDSPSFSCFAESLPQPGKGTLSFLMGKYPPESKSRIRMKSGSMTGVRCYCGYIIPTEGSRDETIVFTVMVNNYFGSPRRLQTFLEKLVYLLSLEN